MTCIIGLEHDGKVFIGGDSAAVNSSWNFQVMDGRKVFEVGEFLIGYTTSFRMGQLLEFNLRPPERGEEGRMRYLVTKFIPAVRECMKDGGYTEIKDNRESAGEFLIGYQGEVFKVSGDFQVLRFKGGMAAVGCGQDYALGAMQVLRENRQLITADDVQQIILRALEVAARFCVGVRQPFYVMVK